MACRPKSVDGAVRLKRNLKKRPFKSNGLGSIVNSLALEADCLVNSMERATSMEPSVNTSSRIGSKAVDLENRVGARMVFST